MNQHSSTVVNLLTIYKELFNSPTEEVFELVSDPKMLKLIESNLILLSKNISIFPLFQGSFKNLQSEYAFVVNNKAQPIESLYKVWTIDSSCTMPFAKSKGFLYGDSALHIKYLLIKFNLDIPEEKKFMPDHLCILIELLIYFIENTSNSFVNRFILDHFDWIEDWVSEVKKVDNKSFYFEVCQSFQELIVFYRNYTSESKVAII